MNIYSYFDHILTHAMSGVNTLISQKCTPITQHTSVIQGPPNIWWSSPLLLLIALCTVTV